MGFNIFDYIKELEEKAKQATGEQLDGIENELSNAYDYCREHYGE